MCVVINQFLFPSNLCDMPRFHCATCSGLPVRLAPVLLCDLLRIMHHHNAGEATPVDWGHFINAVYKVRCNLFHGLKAAHSEMDQVIVHSSYLALVKFLDEVGYINA